MRALSRLFSRFRLRPSRCQRYIPLVNEASDPHPSEYLYVVLPYFNFCGFSRRKELFEEFVERICKQPRVRILVSEAICSSAPIDAQLPTLPGVWKHLRFHVDHQLWVKESLIRGAVNAMPFAWKYMAWVDADLTFLRDDWVDATMRALDTWDVVQMFHTCINMGPRGEALKIDRSFGFMHRDSGHPFHRTDKYGHWHPGFAWACTNHAYEKMGGLLDIGILGSGDRHMAMALIGHVEWSAPGNIHPNYMKKLTELQERVRGLTLGYVHGSIIHHWHGRFEDRKYRERWDILTKLQYDPCADVARDMVGILRFTDKGARLCEPICEYFIGRREDHKSLLPPQK